MERFFGVAAIMTKLEGSITPEAPAAAPDLPVSPAISRSALVISFAVGVDDAANVAAWLQRLSGAKAKSEIWRAIYFDTPDHSAAALGLGFGIRRRPGSHRGRWRRFVEPLSAAASRQAPHELSRRLQAAATIDVVARNETRRQLWTFFCSGERVEASLERVVFLSGDQENRVASVRLACVAPNADFFALATELRTSFSLRLNAETDLARVYRRCGLMPAHVTAFPPKLAVGMSAEEAFRIIATACFEHFLLNEAAIRESQDHEAVHQCRVALRRLSACFRFFSSFVEGDDFENLRTELKELGGYLRMARDLDVMIDTVVAPGLADGPFAGAKDLTRAIEARRDKAYADLVARLEAPLSGALFFRLVAWLYTGKWTESGKAKLIGRRNQPISEFARKTFAKMAAKFAARCAAFSEMGKEARHKTRIRAKNLRYDAEFFTELVRGAPAEKKLAAFVQYLKKLQTVLGDWNDVLMSSQFLSSFAEATEAEIEAAGDKDAAEHRRRAAAAARALAERIAMQSDSDFPARSATICDSWTKVRPFWTKLA